jgi:hypothetical protein
LPSSFPPQFSSAPASAAQTACELRTFRIVSGIVTPSLAPLFRGIDARLNFFS